MIHGHFRRKLTAGKMRGRDALTEYNSRMDENPYQPPPGHEEAATLGKQRFWNVWVFAMTWPLVAILVHRLTLPLIPVLGKGWPTFAMFASVSPFLIGYVLCIVAAVQYRAPVMTRVMRGVGSILLFIASGLVARLVFAAIYLSLH
jgi:hypothetical protein